MLFIKIMNKINDIYIWNVIFQLLDQNSKINLMLSCANLIKLKYFIHEFIFEKGMKQNILQLYPNINNFTCNIDNDIMRDPLNLINLTTLNCSFCQNITNVENLINLKTLNCYGCLNSVQIQQWFNTKK